MYVDSRILQYWNEKDTLLIFDGIEANIAAPSKGMVNANMLYRIGNEFLQGSHTLLDELKFGWCNLEEEETTKKCRNW